MTPSLLEEAEVEEAVRGLAMAVTNP